MNYYRGSVFNYYIHSKPIKKIFNWNLLDQGCNVENFIFNFYDYLIWESDINKYSKFEFTYRTSVEHFYPQTPMSGHKLLTEDTGLNKFGNLCLISRGMNSKFSNNMPVAKCGNFGSEVQETKLSLKLIEMMEICVNTGWDSNEISEYDTDTKKRISIALDSI